MSHDNNGLATPEEIAHGLQCLQRSYADIRNSYEQQADALVRNFFGDGRSSVDIFNEMVRLTKQVLELQTLNAELERKAVSQLHVCCDDSDSLRVRLGNANRHLALVQSRIAEEKARTLNDSSLIRDQFEYHRRCGMYDGDA